MIKYIPKKFVLIRTIYLTIQYAYDLYSDKYAMGSNPIEWAKSTYRILKQRNSN